MRARFPPERIVELAGKLAESAESEQVRLSALQMIAERTHGKVTDRVQHTMGAAEDDEDDLDLDNLSIEQLRELHELEQRRDALLASAQRVSDPLVSDGDVALLPAPVARGDR